MFTVQILWSTGHIAGEHPCDTQAEVLAEIKRIVEDPTTEGDSIRALTIDCEVEFRERPMQGLKFGAHGWPLTEREDGESRLGCPRCDSTNWAMGGQHAVRGTGPGGRGRMGDPGGVDILRCEDCLYESRKPT
jgi:hypothetical protein